MFSDKIFFFFLLQEHLQRVAAYEIFSVLNIYIFVARWSKYLQTFPAPITSFSEVLLDS